MHTYVCMYAYVCMHVCIQGIHVDERDLLFSVMSAYVLKIMTQIYSLSLKEPSSVKLKKLTCSSPECLICHSFALSLESLTTPSADAFQDLLHFDQNGNLLGTTKCGGNVHTMMLNHPHKPSRHVTKDECLERVKTELTAVKEKILTNIIQNLKDQCDPETYYFSWSGLNFQLKLSVPDRMTSLKDIITLYCTTEVHIVQKYTNQKEEDTAADT